MNCSWCGNEIKDQATSWIRGDQRMHPGCARKYDEAKWLGPRCAWCGKSIQENMVERGKLRLHIDCLQLYEASRPLKSWLGLLWARIKKAIFQ